MTTFQKVIKYLAIALALFICITLLSVLIGGVKSLFENFNIIKEKDNEYNEVINYNENFSYLDIDLKSSNLIIKSGESFRIDTSNKDIKIFNENGNLKIVDKSKFAFNSNKDFIITVPYNYNFEVVKIDTGAGKVDINGINTNLLDLDLGAGKTILNNIISNKTLIETGAGSTNIINSKLNDLGLELGVGKIDIVAEITGKSSIECGVGELNLSLNLPLHEYIFEFEKGIGGITLNNKPIKTNSTIGEGDNYVKIEGGVGSINVKTLENN